MLTIIGSDIHTPYQDDVAVSKFVEHIQRRNPDRVVLNGDTWDMMQISRFEKSPARIPGLQDDIDVGIDLVLTIRRAMRSDAELVIVEGNHEARLQAWLNSKGAEVSSLRALKPNELFQLERLQATWVPYKKRLVIDGVLVLHGHLVRKRSGYTAHGYFDLYGASGTTGHTHRLCIVYRTINGEVLAWAESGCLCKIDDVEYMHDGSADWQHGCVEIENGEISVVAF